MIDVLLVLKRRKIKGSRDGAVVVGSRPCSAGFSPVPPVFGPPS